MQKEDPDDSHSTDAREAAPATSPPRGLLREYAESGAVVIVMAFFFMTFVAQSAVVPSASMENTIYVGDHFLVNKFVFGPGPALPVLPQREVRRGDIVVFKFPGPSNPPQGIVQYKTLFIKRVIGLPGETIQVKGAHVYVDGRELPEYRIETRDEHLGNDKAKLEKLRATSERAGEPYAVYYTPDTLARREGEAANPFSDLKLATGTPFKIPEDSYFMMGDNRDNSADSRVWGPVSRDLIVGRAMFVIWSFDEHAPSSAAVFPLNFVSDFFNHTRWSRMGTLLR
ncbi:MAG TPA: signal peptidase I [Pyrinomonadaceae bacterium]|jgi:signal peptidase I|nr:signal peptidase I [Pyrinomonadaceae bacterium]